MAKAKKKNKGYKIIEVIIKNGKQKKGKEFKVNNNDHLKKVAEYLRLYIYQKHIDDIDLTTEIKFKLDGKKISPNDLKLFLKSSISEDDSIKSSDDKKSSKKKSKKNEKKTKKQKNDPYFIPMKKQVKSEKSKKNKKKKSVIKNGKLLLHANLKGDR